MGKALIALLVIYFVLSDPLCHAQTSVKVPNPRLEVKGNTIHISYDILNGNPGETYMISIDIRDQDGNIIKANSLEGDIGMVEAGGVNKQIIWDPGADNVFINSQIFIKVNVQVIIPPKPDVIAPEETTIEKQDEINEAKQKEEIIGASPAAEAKSYSRTGIIIQSLALPGLGLSRVTGNPHWLKGVAGYACIAGSVTLNRIAISNYEGITDLVEFDDKNGLYQKASTQNNMSQVLAYTAVAIWITDFVWTLVGTSDLKNDSQLGQSKRISIQGRIDPVSSSPLLSLSYHF